MKTNLIRIGAAFLLFFSATSLFAAAKKSKMEKPKPVSDKPEIQRIEPRGIQRGVETRIRLVGNNLAALTEIKTNNKKLKAEIDREMNEKETEAWIKIMPQSDLTRGVYEISAVNEKDDSGKVKIYVDDLPQAYEFSTNKTNAVFPATTPVTFWGTLEPAADSDQLEFEAKAGQNLVLDLAAKSIGSKANIIITLFDPKGNPVASNNSFDGGDPLLFCKVAMSGRYSLRISEEQLGGSSDHFYRISIGELPLVVSGFPLSLKTNAEAMVELIGFNLSGQPKVQFKAEKPGDMDVPVDAEKFRLRKNVKVLVTDQNESIEAEPNDLLGTASKISVPAVVCGRIWNESQSTSERKPAQLANIFHSDVDLFQFEAKAGQTIVLETDAARRGSPIDTKIEILHSNGKPVERVLLQGVRDSHVTFRPVDSVSGDLRVENWQEMELNELMYLQGEVCKIFRMPEGPDSGFRFYRNGGKRITYFDTSATAHALDEACYIVEPHPPGTKLVPNGLPNFTLYYANDDDGERELGSDSRLLFTPTMNGTYLARVTDNRGSSGDRFGYRLIVREAKPDFKVTLNGAGNITVSPGSCQEFTFIVDRMDGFDEDITLDITGAPEGFYVSTPIVMQAGHLQASGSLCAAPDAKEPAKELLSKMKITASALIGQQKVTKEVDGFGSIKLGEKPKLLVAIEPYAETNTNFNVRAVSDSPMEITVTPGEVTPIWLKIRREGHEDLVTFTVENLPHGVIVDNIGLNGVLIPKGENERQIFLKCAKWVPETDRLAYCQAKQAGNPTSFPVLVHVKKSDSQSTASK